MFTQPTQPEWGGPVVTEFPNTCLSLDIGGRLGEVEKSLCNLSRELDEDPAVTVVDKDGARSK